ncbi:MAG: hypothetical protein PHT13_02160 [Methanosarcina sp.]|nr:hypothetical protein [Methanosarcina sp.]
MAGNSITQYIELDNLTKFSISIITISFITVLNLTDQYYQDMAKAVTCRLRVLETMILNFELNEMISYQFFKGNMAGYIKWTYNGLIIIAVAVGVAVIVSAPNTTLTNVANLSDRSIFIFILKLLLLSILLLLSSILLIGPLFLINNVKDGSKELWNCIKEYLNKDGEYTKKEESRSNECMKNKDGEYTKKEESRSKLCDSINECFNSTRRLFGMFLLSIYYAFILFFTYYILVHYLFSSKTTLSLLLLFAGCTGIHITNISSELISRNRADRSKVLTHNFMEIPDAYDPGFLKKTQLDWIIDRLSCKRGEIVRITVINHGKNVKFKHGICIFEIKSDDGEFRYHICAKKDIIVCSNENYSWLWDTGKDTETGILPDGVCRIKPCVLEIPIRRSIFIH